MTRTTLTIILLTIFNTAFGQDNFDYHKEYEVILEQSQDSTSDYYYRTLLNRFNQNDSTLTNLEVLALQIGFTADTNYKPYRSIETEREITSLISQEKYKEALTACNNLLKTYPVNFTALLEKSFTYMKLDKDSMLFHKEKLRKVLSSIMTSGVGTFENPFFVLSPLDGQTLITHIWGGSIGMMGSGYNPNGYFCDILEMKKDGKDPVKLYFNIDHAMNNSEFKRQIDEAIKKMEKEEEKGNGKGKGKGKEKEKGKGKGKK